MLLHRLTRGLVAGAAGTTALNAVTYLDMAVRARPASETPAQAVDKIAAGLGHPVPGEDDKRENRLAGLGPMSGILTGVGIGAVAGLLRPALDRLPAPVAALLVGGTAMLAADAPLAKLQLSRPGDWSLADWLSDVIPHLAYGAVTFAVLRDATEAVMA